MSREKFGSWGGPSVQTLLIKHALRCSETADSADASDAYDTARKNREECALTLSHVGAGHQEPSRSALVDRLIADHNEAVEEQAKIRKAAAE